jgi:hypothetical protein
MEVKDNKNNLFLLTIVAIVAIVAIVIMIASSGLRTYNLSEDTVGEASIATSTQFVTDGKSSITRVPTPVITASCTDTDNGKNYGIKGTVAYTYGSRKDSKSDYCRKYNSATLSEQYCKSGKLASTDYKCSYGCIDGACKEHASNLVTQTISLTTGWNYISLNVKPDSLMVTDLMSALVEEGSLELIKNNAGQIYYPKMNINQLVQISLNEGYLINVNKNTQLTIVGEKIPLPYTIPLSSGWNMMSYPTQNTANAMDVLSELKSSGVLVKVQDEAGNAIENLPGIGWVDNIKQFKPGEGYSINVNQATKIAIKENYNTGYCGDGLIGPGEQCDGTDLKGLQCIHINGFTGGDLSCYPAKSQNGCSWDTSKCVELHVNVEETSTGNVADVAQKDTVLITWTANSNMANYMRYIDAIHLTSDLRVRVEYTNNIIGASGKYSWTIPSYLPDGEYVIEIGAQPQGYGTYSRSEVFKIN